MWYIASLCCLLTILAVLAMIGTAFVDLCLPRQLRPQALEFLTPVLGLGLLLFPVTVIGWFGSGFRWWICLPVTLAMAVAGWRLARQRSGQLEARAMGRLAGFATLTSFPILGQLLRYNAFSPFSDVWVYVCHAQWLQGHGYHEHPALSAHHPVAVQIAFWQWGDLRITPSMLLGWQQAVFGLDWSYQLYPATLAVAMVCGALAVGGAVRAVWPHQRQAAWWSALVAGTTLNGFVCGAASGFFPQTLGMAFAMTALALRGMGMMPGGANAAARRGAFAGSLRAALPLAVCLSATLYCYPEVCPFLALGIGMTYLLPWPEGPAGWRSRGVSLGLVAFVAAVLVSPEAVRAVHAMHNQATSLTGFPVEWSPGGFLAHSLGGKSGPVEGGRWFYEGGWANLATGTPVVIGFLLLLVWAGRRPRGTRPARRTAGRWLALVPSLAVAIVCTAASLYFRWFVANPWPLATKAVGQTFHQYKLALWASLALLTVATAVVIGLAGRWRALAPAALAAWCALGIGGVNGLLLPWVSPILQASGERQDPFGSYRAFCESLSARPVSETIYLSAASGDLPAIKRRELLAYFLGDRELLGNWTDDALIPLRQMRVENHDSAREADWVVHYQPTNEAPPRLCGLTVARPRRDQWPAPEITGGYNRELTPDGRPFYWTARELRAVWRQDGAEGGGAEASAIRMRLSFATYSLAPAQTITVRVMQGGNLVTALAVTSGPAEKAFVSEPFSVVGDEMQATFTGSALPVHASADDPRELSYQVIAASLEPVRD